jgi:hypothetical protein
MYRELEEMKMKNMKYKAKSIKTVMTEHKDALFGLCMRPDQFPLLKAKVSAILDSEALAGNQSVPEAKEIFRKAENQYNRYISILMTYMTASPIGK